MQKGIPGQVTSDLYIIQQELSLPFSFFHYNIKDRLFHFFFAKFMI